ncbi:MAG: TetR/AcrR family transcriptional regulator [Halioglobus sp.]
MATEKTPKREVTRGRVIKAAIDSIYRDGFNAAHTNRIAEEAGVSWGVLQYHFGDKDGLLQAVLDHIFEGFIASLSQAKLEGSDTHERVKQLIDAIWPLFSKKEYRVSIAILRNAGKDESSKINGQNQVKAWAATMSRLWDELLPEGIAGTKQSETARHLLFAGLRGLADDINPRARLTKSSWQDEREALGDAIANLLTSKHQ